MVHIISIFSSDDWNEKIKVFSVKVEKYAESIGRGAVSFFHRRTDHYRERAISIRLALRYGRILQSWVKEMNN